MYNIRRSASDGSRKYWASQFYWAALLGELALLVLAAKKTAIKRTLGPYTARAPVERPEPSCTHLQSTSHLPGQVSQCERDGGRVGRGENWAGGETRSGVGDIAGQSGFSTNGTCQIQSFFLTASPSLFSTGTCTSYSTVVADLMRPIAKWEAYGGIKGFLACLHQWGGGEDRIGLQAYLQNIPSFSWG